MYISTQTHYTARRFGIVKAVEMLAGAGFEAIDLSMFEEESTEEIYGDGYKELAAKLVETAQRRGVVFNQAHAPFPTVRWQDREYSERIWPKVIRSIEMAGLVGAKSIIVHPACFPENLKENNMKMYRDLEPYAAEAGVKIALENMWGRDGKRGYIVPNVCSVPAELADYFDSLNPEHFTVCLDIGHCGLVGEDEADFIRYLGADRLGCLHIHDNNYREDSHVVPFSMNLDWKSIAGALGEIGYRGDFTLEADNTLSNVPDGFLPTTLRYMHDAAEYLAKMSGLR